MTSGDRVLGDRDVTRLVALFGSEAVAHWAASATQLQSPLRMVVEEKGHNYLVGKRRTRKKRKHQVLKYVKNNSNYMKLNGIVRLMSVTVARGRGGISWEFPNKISSEYVSKKGIRYEYMNI